MNIRAIYTICGNVAKNFLIQKYGPNAVHMERCQDFTLFGVNTSAQTLYLKIVFEYDRIYIQNGNFFDRRFINIEGNENGFRFCNNSVFPNFPIAMMHELFQKIKLQITEGVYKRESNLDKIFFNEKKGITTILWKDGTKTFSKIKEGETFDYETGVAMAFIKKFFKSRNDFKKMVEEAVDKSKRTRGK